MDSVILADLAGTDLPVLFHAIGAADPGPIGANRVWLDTGGGAVAHKVRNAANTGWLRLGLTVRDLVLVPHQAMSTVPNTVSTTAWSEWVAKTDVVLGAGLWEVAISFNGIYNPAGAATGPEVRVGAPFISASLAFGAAVGDRTPAVIAVGSPANAPVASDGVIATPFRIEYRRNPATGGGTVNAEQGAFVAICKRVG